MGWVLFEIKLSPSHQPYFISLSPPAPENSRPDTFDLNSKVSPSILLIIIILAIIFFISGLLHLLVRFLLRPPNREPEDSDNVTALQGQLQQLFHLHDAGVDQSFIDTLPVFLYKAIIGSKNPFDCAVCLCEFEPEDKLRLLPKCSHAFHVDCIDTWLLSHSTCPLCRATLLPDFSPNNSCSPIVFVLESASESSREILGDRDSGLGRTSSVVRNNSIQCFRGDNELGSSHIDFSQKSCEIVAKDDVATPPPTLVVDSEEKVVPVKLGKFKSVDGGEGSSSSNVDSRRCFSMGSFEYVMDENSFLQVPIRTPLKKKQTTKKRNLPLTPGHKLAMSECDCESRREFNGFEGITSIGGMKENASIERSKKESFSISKIWLRGKKENQNSGEDTARRAFSFRFPVQQQCVFAADEDAKVKSGIGGDGGGKSNSEIGSCRWGDECSGEIGFDEENQSCNSLDYSQAKTPSFARKTLLWLVGRQNKVVHSSFSPNV